MEKLENKVESLAKNYNHLLEELKKTIKKKKASLLLSILKSGKYNDVQIENFKKKMKINEGNFEKSGSSNIHLIENIDEKEYVLETKSAYDNASNLVG